MSSLIEIQSQIEMLKQQEADIKARDFDATVADILAKMQAFNITAKQLRSAANEAGIEKLFSAATAVKGVKGEEKITRKYKVKTARPPVEAKYRGPNGEEWSGRGLTPRWLSALIAQGSTKDQFAIAH
ncbi:MAG: hypothetical protein RIR79_2252 [Pseudomonadota bacterium]|jgi:DNA-binding protein H-NS